SAEPAPAKTSIPWPACRGGAGRSQLAAKAGADYQGDGLDVMPAAEGARLRCVFQRLEGEATREGLWLTSTVTNAVKDRFRIVATGIGRQSRIVGDEVTSLTSKARVPPEPVHQRTGKRSRAAAVQNLAECRGVCDGAP